MEKLPQVLDWCKVSFHPLRNNSAVNLTVLDKPERTFLFGHTDMESDNETSRVVAVIENYEVFSTDTRSTLWRVSEIQVERRSNWLIFSRIQNDLSHDALSDFLVDTQNFLNHLRDEQIRLTPIENR